MRYLFLLILFFTKVHSIFVGNPAAPNLLQSGIIFKSKYMNLKAAYLYNNIYYARYKDKIHRKDSENSFVKLRTNASILTANIHEHLDILGILGSSKFKMDQNVSTNSKFSWGLGGKMIIFKKKNIFAAADVKYFRTKQGCDVLIDQKEVFPIVTPNFGFLYEEYQGALTAGYKIDIFIPYLGVTYLYSTITPYPYEKGVIRYPYPDNDILGDFFTYKTKNSKNWGLVIGSSIFSNSKILLTIEGRMFDQNSIGFLGEVRF